MTSGCPASHRENARRLPANRDTARRYPTERDGAQGRTTQSDDADRRAAQGEYPPGRSAERDHAQRVSAQRQQTTCPPPDGEIPARIVTDRDESSRLAVRFVVRGVGADGDVD